VIGHTRGKQKFGQRWDCNACCGAYGRTQHWPQGGGNAGLQAPQSVQKVTGFGRPVGCVVSNKTAVAHRRIQEFEVAAGLCRYPVGDRSGGRRETLRPHTGKTRDGWAALAGRALAWWTLLPTGVEALPVEARGPNSRRKASATERKAPKLA